MGPHTSNRPLIYALLRSMQHYWDLQEEIERLGESSRTEPANCDMMSDHSTSTPTDLQHHLMTLTLQGKSCLCPKSEGARSVLELGTGTGIWAMEYGKPRKPSPLFCGLRSSPCSIAIDSGCFYNSGCPSGR